MGKILDGLRKETQLNRTFAFSITIILVFLTFVPITVY